MTAPDAEQPRPRQPRPFAEQTSLPEVAADRTATAPWRPRPTSALDVDEVAERAKATVALMGDLSHAAREAVIARMLLDQALSANHAAYAVRVADAAKRAAKRADEFLAGDHTEHQAFTLISVFRQSAIKTQSEAHTVHCTVLADRIERGLR